MALPRLTQMSEVERRTEMVGGGRSPSTREVWYVDGQRVPTDEITPSYRRKLEMIVQANEYSDNQITQQAEKQGLDPEEALTDADENLDFAESFGWTGEFNIMGDVEDQLIAAGADMQNEDVQRFLQDMPDGLMEEDPEKFAFIVTQLAKNKPSPDRIRYDQALEEAGFGASTDFQMDKEDLGPTANLGGRENAGFTPLPGSDQNTQESGDWLRFGNGVLVSPDGQLVFEPGSNAPGSHAWRRNVVPGWSEEKVAQERRRLYELGYLSKDQMKLKGVDEHFLDAVQLYHQNRYKNGGKDIPLDLGAGAGARDERAKLVDVREEMGASIRNTVRETYRNIYGTDPTDGEVAAFSSTIFETAMELQRKYRKKYGDPNVGSAVSEATERQIEKLEGSPQATFLRESEEENTRLADALSTAAMATRGLA